MPGVAALNEARGHKVQHLRRPVLWGQRVPTHVKQQYPSSVLVCNGVELPRYWDPDYQRGWGGFIQKLGQRYNNDPNVDGSRSAPASMGRRPR